MLISSACAASGQGDANARVAFQVGDGGGTIDTEAQITGTAMSMGEGIVTGILDELIKDFAEQLAVA